MKHIPTALAPCLLILEEYEKKSNVFIEIESISGAQSASGETIPAKKLQSEMEGIKKLILKSGEELQCQETFAGVACAQTLCVCKVLSFVQASEERKHQTKMARGDEKIELQHSNLSGKMSSMIFYLEKKHDQYNTCFAVTHWGLIIQHYDRIHLLLFGMPPRVQCQAIRGKAQAPGIDRWKLNAQ